MRQAVYVTLIVATAVATGCAPRVQSAAARTVVPEYDGEFVAPPDLVAASRVGAGAVRIEGRAPWGSRVSLASPDGVNLATTTDPRGTWSLLLPPSASPRLFALSATSAGRVVRAAGALVAAPAPAEPAYLARTGAASMPVYGPGAVRIVAFDYDPGGGAGVAGIATAGARVELAIDGVASGGGRSDAHGRFSLMAVRAPLTPGRHTIAVRTAAGVARLVLRMSPAATLGGAPMRVSKDLGAWRIDWAPPGGGVQTTLALTPPSGV